jgi:hypothetical protein
MSLVVACFFRLPTLGGKEAHILLLSTSSTLTIVNSTACLFYLRKSTSMQLNKLCEAHIMLSLCTGERMCYIYHLNIKGILHLFLTSCTRMGIYSASELFLQTSKAK